MTFESLASVILVAALSFGAFWLFFYMPLKQGRTAVGRTIKATPEAIWRLVDPRNLDFSWNPHWEQQGARILSDEPLIIEYLARPKGSRRAFARRTEQWTRLVDAKSLSSCVVEPEKSEADSSEENYEHLDLAATANGGTRVVLTAEGPIRGLFGFELRRIALEKYLAALESAVLGRRQTRKASIRFIGWRLAALAVLSMFALVNWSLFFKPFSSGAYFSASLATASLIVALLLHEFGHALALVAMGHRDVTISLIPFVGGVAASKGNYENAFEAGVVAISGIAFSALACLLLLPSIPYLDTLIASLLFGAESKRAAIAPHQGLLPWIALCAFGVVGWQLIVNSFNIMPFPGSDGLRLLQSIFSNRAMRRIAALCVCVLFAAILGSMFILLVPAIFWVAAFLMSSLTRKSSSEDEVICSQQQRVALAAVFTLSALCLGFEVNQTQAFMGRAKSMFEDRHLWNVERAGLPASGPLPVVVPGHERRGIGVQAI